jgi:hypothetical protein
MTRQGTVQCQSCGYITDAVDRPCGRCGASLVDAEVIAGAVEGPAVPTGESSEPSGEGAEPYLSPPYYRTQTGFAPPRPNQTRRPVNWTGLLILLGFAVGVVAIVLGFGVFHIVKRQVEKLPARGESKEFLARQPDFRAECEGTSGTWRFSGMMAQKGDSFLAEMLVPRSVLLEDVSRQGLTKVAVISASGRPKMIVIHELRTYLEDTATTGPFGRMNPRDVFNGLVAENSVTVEGIGTETVNGYETQVYKIVNSRRESDEALAYVSRAHDGLIVKFDATWQADGREQKYNYSLRNVSLTVDGDLFRVPVTYTKVPWGG